MANQYEALPCPCGAVGFYHCGHDREDFACETCGLHVETRLGAMDDVLVRLQPQPRCENYHG